MQGQYVFFAPFNHNTYAAGEESLFVAQILNEVGYGIEFRKQHQQRELVYSETNPFPKSPDENGTCLFPPNATTMRCTLRMSASGKGSMAAPSLVTTLAAR